MNKFYILSLVVFFAFNTTVSAQRQMEFLDRGLIAVRTGSDSVFLSWRLTGIEPENLKFNIYRVTGTLQPLLLNKKPLQEGTNFMDSGVDFSQVNQYYIKTIGGNKESEVSKPYTLSANIPVQNYLNIPLQTPKGYAPNDASIGDLDGDGQYEIVIHMAGSGRDNGSRGITSPPVFHAYKMDGSLLWKINLGKNIREGAHYTQFLVYDFDGDGRAEVAMKTANGTADGIGNVIGDSTADDRNKMGHIYKGTEFLTIFNGFTGAAMATVDYIPGRHPSKQQPAPEEVDSIWGDDHYNRSERYLACVAYLDGVRPSLVMCRGYYSRAVLAAWNWRDGKLSHVWTFDSDDGTAGNRAYRGQGNHNLSVGDADGDGKDEIMYGACAIDDNGKGLYSTGFGHADAMHFTDHDPEIPGLEVFNIQERFDDAGMNMRKAGSGEVIWKIPSKVADESGGDKGEGPGRGLAVNIDPRYKGSECWAFGAGMNGLYNAKGIKITDKTPRSCNFAIWWDGDLLREILDRNYIAKWNWNLETLETIFVANGCSSNNWTKANPALSADIFGDWREEVILRTTDNKNLRVYTTTIPTNYRFYTLMHDPIYRLGIVWQNVAYNQPPHTGFYMGDDMAKPPKPNIYIPQK